MSWTPTTEEAKEIFYDSPGMQSPRLDGAEFDRWLSQVRADAFDEGWGNGFIYGYMKKPEEENYKNPYKQGEEQ